MSLTVGPSSSFPKPFLTISWGSLTLPHGASGTMKAELAVVWCIVPCNTLVSASWHKEQVVSWRSCFIMLAGEKLAYWVVSEVGSTWVARHIDLVGQCHI